MVEAILKKINTDRWLWVFIWLHVAAWTLAPALVRFNLPMDSIEGATWGRQLEWGYDKNPFMNGWLTTLALKIDGHSGWAIYLFSQLSVAICFWAVYQLGKKILPPVYALISVLVLEGMQYYNFHAIDFNDNTLELGIWALTTLFFYQALSRNKLRDWILTGIFAALGMMTKYFIVVLLFPMLLLLLSNPQGRKEFKKPRIYLALMVFIAIITPHVIWLFSHDFVTLGYAVDRVASPPNWFNHLFYPAQFAWQLFEVLIPALFLSGFLLLGKKPMLLQPRIKLTLFDQRFLFFVGLGPFLLTVLLAASTGIQLRAGWGQPLLSLWGLVFIAWLQPYLTITKFYRFLAAVFIFLALAIAGYAIALTRATEESSANYPGKEIAATLTNRWHQQYHRPLSYVAGSRWLAGNIAFYSKDRPQVYINWDHRISPWIDESTLKQQGAIFVWDLSDGQTEAIDKIKARFSKLSHPKVYTFNWLRNTKLSPIRVLVAFLPPQNN